MVHSNVAAELASIDRQFPMMPNPQVCNERMKERQHFNNKYVSSSFQPGDFSVESQDWAALSSDYLVSGVFGTIVGLSYKWCSSYEADALQTMLSD